MKKVLLINGHQRYEGFAEGKLNHTLADKATEMLNKLGYDVRSTVIEQGYDIEEELEKHQWADVVFVQTPAYWMSVPYLFKKYIDEVYTTGLVQGVVANDDGRTRADGSKKYGSGGLFTDKKYMFSTTWNAPLESFEDPQQFFKGQDVDAVFLWMHKNFEFFGMQPLPTFSCYDVLKNPDIQNDLQRFEQHINQVFNA